MSAILKFDFQKKEQLRFSEVNSLNYIKKDLILHVATTFFLKHGETRTSHGPIPHPSNLAPENSGCLEIANSLNDILPHTWVQRKY